MAQRLNQAGAANARGFALNELGGGAEMLLWLKTPGESDGNCGVGAGSSAGQFLPEVAYKLIYGY
jgi:endoglucanase